ncbi:MAG: HIT family protein [Lachnospiraceae bacterium]|jgi:hypothetical protein|nr:HIT family protein [Lachnospiraceae bacterium]MBF1013987.1 HIT family protein [Lachnospiraceae bacterium]
MKDENCIFCKLANGDIPTATVYEDEYLRAIMDAAPANKGHIIILPKSHAANIYELEDEYVSRAFVLAKKLAVALKKLTGCDGVNILQNNGEAAGQTVFHFHVHVIPRFKNDDCTIVWKPTSYEDGEASEVAKKIAELL